MRRLAEILSFRKACYRRTLARRTFSSIDKSYASRIFTNMSARAAFRESSRRNVQALNVQSLATPPLKTSSAGAPPRQSRVGWGPRLAPQPVQFAENTLQKKVHVIEVDINRYGRITPDYIMDYIKAVKPGERLPPNHALTLLHACGPYLPMFPNAKRLELVHNIWDLFLSHGINYNISHYNALLSMYLFNEHSFLPVEFLARLEKDKVEANRVTFQRLIHRYAQMGDLNGASKILEHMKASSMPINEQVFNSLVYGNVKTKNADGLKSIFDIMSQNNMEKTNATYSEMMKAYAEQGDVAKIEEIIQQQSEIVFGDREILDVIYHLVKNGHKKHVEQMLKYLRKTSGYIHEAVNCALKINALRALNEAVDILATIPRAATHSGETAEFGAVLLRQAVDLDFTEQEMMKLADRLKATGLHKRSLELVYQIAAEKKNKNVARAALSNLLSYSNFDVKSPCFWPLLVMSGKENDTKTAAWCFSLMNKSEDLSKDLLATLTDWFWPNFDKFVNLADVGKHFPEVPFKKFVSSYVTYCLQKSDKENILKTIERYPNGLYVSGLLLRSVQSYVNKTNDIDTTVAILINMINNTNARSFFYILPNPVDYFLQGMVFQLPEETLLNLFTQLANKGFCCSSNIFKELKALPQEPNKEIMSLFEKMLDNQRIAATRAPQSITQDFSSVEQKSTMPTTTSQEILRLIENKEIDKAVELVVNAANTNRYLPQIVPVMAAVAEAGDTEKLQKLYNLTVGVRTESVGLMYLAFALSSIGKCSQARYLLKNAGDKFQIGYFIKYREHLVNKRDSKSLENLLKTTLFVPKVERQRLYYALLLTYKASNNYKSAVNVLTSMQEENIAPVDEIMQLIYTICKSNDQPVPFDLEPAADVGVSSTGTSTPISNKQMSNNLKWNVLLQELIEHPENENRILELASKSMPSGRFGPTAALWLSHVFHGRFAEAENFVKNHVGDNVNAMLKEIHLVQLCQEFKKHSKVEALNYFLDKNVFGSSPNARPMFYSYLIGIKMQNQDFNGACGIIERAGKDNVGLERLNIAILSRLSADMKRHDLPVPFDLDSIRKDTLERKVRGKPAGGLSPSNNLPTSSGKEKQSTSSSESDSDRESESKSKPPLSLDGAKYTQSMKS